MTLGQKLARLRREREITQEQLAERLGVTRQAVSKWESNSAYPETEKLIQLAKLYGCSLDDLLLDREPEGQSQGPRQTAPREVVIASVNLRGIAYERVSQRKIAGLPLWHINIGYGRVAKGVFALGLTSVGIVSVGLCSVGLAAFGVLGVGFLAMGSLAVGVVSLGAIALGVLAAGAVAVGLFSLGACAIGRFAVGAAAVGTYAALGDSARAAVAIGTSQATGALFQTVEALSPGEIQTVREVLRQTTPWYLGWCVDLFCLFLK